MCCAAEHGETPLAPQPFRIVAGGHQQLASILNTNAVQLDQAWRELLHQWSDEIIELSHFIIELEEPTRQ